MLSFAWRFHARSKCDHNINIGILVPPNYSRLVQRQPRRRRHFRRNGFGHFVRHQNDRHWQTQQVDYKTFWKFENVFFKYISLASYKTWHISNSLVDFPWINIFVISLWAWNFSSRHCKHSLCTNSDAVSNLLQQ